MLHIWFKIDRKTKREIEREKYKIYSKEREREIVCMC